MDLVLGRHANPFPPVIAHRKGSPFGRAGADRRLRGEGYRNCSPLRPLTGTPPLKGRLSGGETPPSSLRHCEPVRTLARQSVSPIKISPPHWGRDIYWCRVSCCGARHHRRRRCAFLCCRPLPLARVAVSATGSAPLAPPLGNPTKDCTRRLWPTTHISIRQ